MSKVYFNYAKDRLTVPESQFSNHSGTLRCMCEMNDKGHILDQYTCSEFRDKKCNKNCDTCGITVAIDKLVDYEDTGLSPEEIKSLAGEGSYEKFIDHVRQAQTEAFKRGINANAVLIGDHLRFTRLKYLMYDDLPMILGMKCVYTNELPDDVTFAVAALPRLPIAPIERMKDLEAENKELKAKLKQIISFLMGKSDTLEVGDDD